MHHVATHDALTDLPNRTLLWDRLELMINQAHRDRTQIAVLFLDLDHFKAINDSYGHQTGDEVLIIVAKRLTQCLRESDTVARLGGDEFVILLGNVTHRQGIGIIAQKFMDAVVEPIWMNNLNFSLTCSMGISLFPGDSLEAEALIKNADRAMYHAKEEGRNHFCFFTPEMDVEEKVHMALGYSLQHALARNEFCLEYQPLVDLQGGHIVEVEAFLRWQHPELGVVLPSTIIPLAEETGMIGMVCNWVIRTGCAQNNLWMSFAGPKTPVKLSLNIATYQYERTDMATTISQTLKACGLPAELLELEFTEDLLIRDPEKSAQTLIALSNLGVGLTIDDFGSGYSSLSYLGRFPVKTIKVDRSLIAQIARDSRTAATVVAIIHFAHAMGIKVVAEGVETGEQLHILRTEGCDWMQGYYFSRPVAAEEMTRLLQEDRRMAMNVDWQAPG